jgi:amidase
MSADPRPCDLSAIDARRAIGQGLLSPVELLESCLGEVDRIDPAVNAMVTRADSRARDEARVAADAVARGDELGPLHGLPIAIKDLHPTEGIVTTFGSEVYADHVPADDAGIVARIRAAGGIVIGKTNLPEMSIGANTVNRLFGATGNPFDVEASCGGSSGGSAVALATNMAPLATGSDHGGSLRIPACYCGVVGHRSSPGLVPHELRTITQTNYSLQGPMARTVPDAALLLSVIARRDRSSRQDPMAFPFDASIFADLDPIDLAELRVGVTPDLGGVMVSDTVRRSFESRVSELERMVGAVVRPAIDLTPASGIDWQLRADVFATQYHRDIDDYDEGFNPNIRRTYENALTSTVLDIARARRAQMELFQQFDEVFDEVDVVLCPGVSVPPFRWRDLYPRTVDGEPVENYMAWLALSASLTVVGNPVTALPAGLDEQGTPFGLQVVGPMHSDHRLLSICAALESAFASNPVLRRPEPDRDRLAVTESACRTDGRTVQLGP